MLEVIKKFRKPLLIIFLAFIFVLSLLSITHLTQTTYVMGATLHVNIGDDESITQANTVIDETMDLTDRFQRPSGEPALDTKYSFGDLENPKESVPLFQNPEDLIKAFFGILSDASNMIDYHGGCGTIGVDKLPYPYAWKLMTVDAKKSLPLENFIESFKGIGHITLLKLLPAYTPPKTPDNVAYYMAEIEVITGPPVTGSNQNTPQPSYFVYYYGLFTLEQSKTEQWKIKSIDYMPEDFLCAPYHSWFWESSALFEIIYQNWYKLIDRIDRIEAQGSMITIYASGFGKEYRFDFVRLTNGMDVLLHENIRVAGQWQETNILKDADQVFKFSVLNPLLN